MAPSPKLVNTPRNRPQKAAGAFSAAAEGTPAGDQYILPGAARDAAGLARNLAAAPLKPIAAQEPCDVGLFSDAHKQRELFR